MTFRIVFFGTPSFAVPALERLLEGPDEVVAVLTQPDREKGRGRKIAPSPVKAFLSDRPVPVFQPQKVKDEVVREEIGRLKPDLFVVVAYGQILPRSLLMLPDKGAINVHASLLPRYRGAAPIPWAILNGERVTGVTTMMMDEGMDTGDILLQREVPVEERETGATLHDKLAVLGAGLLSETVERLRSGDLRRLPQDPSKASYVPLIKKEDGRIDWSKKALDVDRQVRAFDPWPGSFTRWDGRLLRIYAGESREGHSKGRPGEVVWVGAESIEVAAGEGVFVIREVQLEGKRRMTTRDFLSGHAFSSGTIFG